MNNHILLEWVFSLLVGATEKDMSVSQCMCEDLLIWQGYYWQTSLDVPCVSESWFTAISLCLIIGVSSWEIIFLWLSYDWWPHIYS